MKTNIKPDELDRMCESTMRWGSGEEVTAWLDWDDRWFYLWFEPTWNFEDFCEEQGGDMLTMLKELRKELADIGVQKFYDLKTVNDYCEGFCGDNEPSSFYMDDTFGVICGA